MNPQFPSQPQELNTCDAQVLQLPGGENLLERVLGDENSSILACHIYEHSRPFNGCFVIKECFGRLRRAVQCPISLLVNSPRSRPSAHDFSDPQTSERKQR